MEFNWKTARKGHGRTTQDVALVFKVPPKVHSSTNTGNIGFHQGRSITSTACTPRCAGLQTVALTCSAGAEWCNRNCLARALGSLHKTDGSLNLNIVSDQGLLLVGLLSSASTETLLSGECRKNILEVDAGAETSLASETTEASTLSTKSTEAREWMASSKATTSSGGTSTARVEASGAELVELLALLGIGKNLTIVGLFDVAGGCGLIDTKSLPKDLELLS
ncbi:hypothetical protein HG530_010172 [Fusarium avenaceum]|nr:hypothetical protein HG530_010172 [Fusarium avenaceum]